MNDTRRQITWAEAREMLARLHAGLERARDSAREAVLSPERKPADVIYVEAFADLLYRTTGLHAEAELLLEALAESQPPSRPLEAVLADIKAEGHDDIALEHDPAHYEGRWRLQTHHSAPRYVSKGSIEEHRRWVEEVEDGAVFGDTPVEAAEQRLAEIRELHDLKRISLRWVVEMFDVDRLAGAVAAVDTGQAVVDAQDAAGADEEPF